MGRTRTAFVKKIEERLGRVGFFLDLGRKKRAVEKIILEMERGLRGEKSSLAMLPAFIPFGRELKEKEVLALDMGGTNFRAARARVGRRGVKLGKTGEGVVPGLRGEVTPEEFFGDLVDMSRDYLKKKDTIGFTFSYAVEILPGADGRLLAWTKEIKAPKLIGRKIGSGLANVLAKKGLGDCRVVILNDTVAALLSGLSLKRRGLGTFLGLVVGTGTNIAYVERAENILKLPRNLRREGGGEIINMESGNLELVKLGLATFYDRKVDEESKDPGQHTLEKAVSGLYLPRVLRVIVKDLVRLGVVKDEGEGFLEKATSEQISQVIKVASLDKNDPKRQEFLVKNSLSEAFFEVLSCVCHWITDRSAQLGAVMLAGPMTKLKAQGDLLGKVAIVAEGAVFWEIPDYKEKVEESLKELVACDFEFLKVPESGLVGAAIAADLVSG
jgi:hexokinase